MVLNKYRKNVDSLLNSLAGPFMGLNPNTLTYLSLLFAFIGGILFYFDFLIFSFLSILLSSLMDALDGKVARLRKIESKKGDFLDHMIDRYADTFILLGIIFSKYCVIWIGIFALVGVLLTSYMGTQAQALGIGRMYGGILGRADRMIILIFLPLIQFFWWGYIFSITVWVMIIFAILGNITAVQRAFYIWKHLS